MTKTQSSTSSTTTRLGSQAAFFFLGNIFTLLVGWPLQIYVVRIIGADGLGVFGILEGGVSLIAGLIAFGLAPTLVRFIPDHLERGEFTCIRKLVGLGFIVLLAAGSLTYGLLLWAMPFASLQWPVLAQHQAAAIAMGLLIPLGLIIFFLQQGLRGFQEIRYMVIGSSFVQLTVKAALAVLFLSMGFQIVGYVWAVVISVLCSVVWMAVGLRRKLASLPASTDDECLGVRNNAWWKFAKIQYSGSLLGMGMAYLDRFLLGFLVGAHPVGILLVVKQLQQLPLVFLQMFLAVASPMFSAAHARNDAEERQIIYHLTIDWVVRLSAPLFIFFILFAEPLLSLYGEEFARQGKYVLWILLVGQAFNLGCGPVGAMLNMSGTERFVLKLDVYGMVISTTSVCILVPYFGLIGAALAIAITTVLQNCIALWAARTMLKVRWTDRRYLRWILPFAVSIFTAIAAAIGEREPGPVFLVINLVLLYGVFHGVSLAQGVHSDDRELLSHLFNRLGLMRKSKQ